MTTPASLLLTTAVAALVSLAACNPAHAAVQVDNLWGNALAGKKGVGPYRFPEVRGGEAGAMRRINTWLQVTELGAVPGHLEDGIDSSTTSLDFSVTAQTEGYLSLEIDGEYMGAYPSANSKAYSFDLHTGDLITLDELFSHAGLSAFIRRVQADRIKQMDRILAALKHPAAGTDRDLNDDKLGLYSGCRESLEGRDLTHDQLSLGKDGLTLSMAMCASHAQLALDDLFNYDAHYPISAVQPWLSDYGHCLLVDKKTSCVSDQKTLTHGVLHGTIGGRYRITLVFGSQSGNNGYFYDKYGKFIALDGGPDGAGGYRFSEHHDDGSDAILTFKRNANGTYFGTWSQAGSGKEMTVHLGE
jgi:hypothetical protein